jgi:hypothetical protein
LGIDSIKRVEVVSNVFSIFNITVGSDSMDKLGHTRLMGEVVYVFVSDVFGGAFPGGVLGARGLQYRQQLRPRRDLGVLTKVLSNSTGFDEQLLTMDPLSGGRPGRGLPQARGVRLQRVLHLQDHHELRRLKPILSEGRGGLLRPSSGRGPAAYNGPFIGT